MATMATRIVVSLGWRKWNLHPMTDETYATTICADVVSIITSHLDIIATTID
jgi:hypothetical protein